MALARCDAGRIFCGEGGAEGGLSLPAIELPTQSDLSDIRAAVELLLEEQASVKSNLATIAEATSSMSILAHYVPAITVVSEMAVVPRLADIAG